jgi:hypothetical protein
MFSVFGCSLLFSIVIHNVDKFGTLAGPCPSDNVFEPKMSLIGTGSV